MHKICPLQLDTLSFSHSHSLSLQRSNYIPVSFNVQKVRRGAAVKQHTRIPFKLGFSAFEF